MTTPERNLYIAIVEQAVQDFRSILQRVKCQIKRKQSYCRPLRYEFERLRSEVASEWFGWICDIAGVHQSKVLRVMDNEAKEAGLFNRDSKDNSNFSERFYLYGGGRVH